MEQVRRMDNVNFGSVAVDYARWRNDLPEVVLFEQLQAHGLSFSGRHVVDLGSGSGVLCRAASRRGAGVIGIEPSIELIQQAQLIDAEQGQSVSYVAATAEDTGLPDNAFDVVTCLRAWHWFNRALVLSEVRRMLKQNGYLLVMDSGFLAQQSQLASDTLELFRKSLPSGKIQSAGSKANAQEFRNGFPTEWFGEWEVAGFHLIDAWQFGYEVAFTPDAWRGRVRSLSLYSKLALEKRAGLDAELERLLEEVYFNETIEIPHVFRVVMLHMSATREQ